MAYSIDDTTLSHRHYITLILRLTLDKAGRLIQGELVDTTDSPQQRFLSIEGLHQAVETWLTQHEQANDDTTLSSPEAGL